MAFKDNLRLEQIYFQNIKSTIDVLKSWKGNTEDGKTSDIIDAVITCDNAVLLLYKNIGECWNELTAQIQKEMKDLADLKQQTENYHDELNEKIDDVNNYIMAIIREIEARLDIIENDLATLQRNRIFVAVYDDVQGEWQLTYNDTVVDFDEVYDLIVSEDGVLANALVKLYDEDLETFIYLPLLWAKKDEEDPDNNDIFFRTYNPTYGGAKWKNYLTSFQFDFDAYGTNYSKQPIINFGWTDYMLSTPSDFYLSPTEGTQADDEVTLDLANAPYIFGSKESTYSLPLSTMSGVRYIKFSNPKLRYQYAYQFGSAVKVPYDCNITIKLYYENVYNTDAKLLGTWQANFKGCIGVDSGTTSQIIPVTEGVDNILIDFGQSLDMFSEKHSNVQNLYIKLFYSFTFNDVNQALDTSVIRGALVDRQYIKAL